MEVRKSETLTFMAQTQKLHPRGGRVVKERKKDGETRDKIA